MPIRPIDIRRREFRNGFRGYDANQVDDFLDTVADEFERTYNENQRMREEVSGLRDRLQQFEDLEGSIRAALVHAEQAANDLRRSANREAEDVRQGARREADFTIRDAQNRSHQMLADSAARIDRVQDSYEALQDAKRSFGNDFRHLLKTYMDRMENMEVSSARDIEVALRERLDTESVAGVREAAATEERRDEPSRGPQPEQPAFGAAPADDAQQDASDIEDPGATARIEPETAAVVEPETAAADGPEAAEQQAGGPLADDEARAEEEETRILRPEEPTSPEPAADEREAPAVDEQGPPTDETGTDETGTDETGTSGADEEPEPGSSTARSETSEEDTGTRAADEVEGEETSLAEESRSQEFFDRENNPRDEGEESRISRASRFLRRRE